MREILQELNQGDAFSIVSFNNSAQILASFRYSATAVKKAIKVIDGLEADGSTNIDEGLKVRKIFFLLYFIRLENIFMLFFKVRKTFFPCYF